MKILLVCEDIPSSKLGGLGKHVVALGNALLDAGHDVTLLGRDRPDYASCADEVGFRGRFIGSLIDPSRYGWKERGLGCFNPLKRTYLARRLARAVRRLADDYDVVHYHGHVPGIGRYLPASVRFVQTRHDHGSECIIHLRFRDDDVCRELAPLACAGCIHQRPGPLRTALSAAAVRRYRRDSAKAFERHPVVFVSSFLRDRYREAVPESNLSLSSVMHNFIDERSLAAVMPGTRPAMARVLVHVAGRLDAPKGIGQWVRLMAPRLPAGWHVQIYGDGPLRHQLEAECASSSVRFHGHQGFEETLQAARAADVVVVPSLWEEPFGAVTLEALRLGKPCFALARGGTPELARYGGPGQLHLFDDLPTLVEALLSERWSGAAGGGESADVSVRLPAILDLYAQIRASHGHER